MRYTVFPLHPDTPDPGMSLDDLFAGQFDISAMMTRLQQVAAQLELPFGDRSHTYNSRKAQELGKWAEQQGEGLAFQDAAYRAYFVDGANIADLTVLKAIVTDIGLDASIAEEVLAEGKYAETVDADWQRARAMRITAVPTAVYDSRQLVGFKPYEDFRALIIG